MRYKPSESDAKSLALVGAGILASFTLAVFDMHASLKSIGASVEIALAISIAYVVIMVAVMIAAILYGLGVLTDWKQKRVRRKRLQGTLMIGIISDIPWNDYTRPYFASDFRPEHWEKIIYSVANDIHLKIEVQQISVDKDFEPFIAILNPYGGAYPEADLGESATLKKIKNYVANGGLFVNVSDVPTYYVYGLTLKKITDNTPALYDTISSGKKVNIVEYRPFSNTPWIKELALRIVTFDSGTQCNVELASDGGFSQFTKCWITYRRAVAIDSNVESCIEPLSVVVYDNSLRIQHGSQNYDISPIFYVNFGKGHFLISLAYLDDEFHTRDDSIALADTLAKSMLDTVVATAKGLP